MLLGKFKVGVVDRGIANFAFSRVKAKALSSHMSVVQSKGFELGFCSVGDQLLVRNAEHFPNLSQVRDPDTSL